MPFGWKLSVMKRSSGTQDHSCKAQPAGFPMCSDHLLCPTSTLMAVYPASGAQNSSGDM